MFRSIGCLLVMGVVFVSAEENMEGVALAPAMEEQNQDLASPQTMDMCELDDIASIICDLCNEMDPSASRDTCCSDVNVLYGCEKLIMAYAPEPDEDSYNAVEGNQDGEGDMMDYEVGDVPLNEGKRASWSWKKPTANRMNNELYDMGFRGKRYSMTGRYSWKPTNYRLDRMYDTGYRGKRFNPMDTDPESYSESMESQAFAKRAMQGRWDWKPAAYRLSQPYRYDGMNYMGKRGAANYDSLFDNDRNLQSVNELDKRARYPGRYDWKPAPYRMDAGWDMSGKRTSFYRRQPSRYDWKPSTLYAGKRATFDWKPPAYKLDNPWSNSELRYMGKRFSLGPGRWNWKPEDKQTKKTKSQFKAAAGKRGRYDLKPSTGYNSFGFGQRNLGKRAAAEFDLQQKAMDLDKRDRYTESWKPWKPAAYRMDYDRWLG